MVEGPWYAAFHGVGALFLDVLPMTIGASPLGQCHKHLPLTTRRLL